MSTVYSNAGPRLRPSRKYIILQCLGWGLYGILNTLFFSGFTFPTLRSAFGNMAVATAGLVLSHLLRNALRAGLDSSPPHRAWLKRVLLGIPACACVLALATAGIQSGLYPQTDFRHAAHFAVLAAVNYVFLFGLWAGCYIGAKLASRSRQSELGRLRALAAARQAELSSLRAQYEPHFLFNTLNTISALTAENPELAREAIRHLSTLLRASLTLNANALVPLAQEWALVGDYLRLEELRFPHRLTIEHDMSPDALRGRLPAFALQTLVENALKHGAHHPGRPREFSLWAGIEADELHIRVTNAGELMPQSANQSGVGMKNLRERLNLLCGNHSSYTLEQTVPGQVQARLLIPQNR